jgi:hypothetical protein
VLANGADITPCRFSSFRTPKLFGASDELSIGFLLTGSAVDRVSNASHQFRKAVFRTISDLRDVFLLSQACETFCIHVAARECHNIAPL